jgi:hypothetical protein
MYRPGSRKKFTGFVKRMEQHKRIDAGWADIRGSCSHLFWNRAAWADDGVEATGGEERGRAAAARGMASQEKGRG